jgi:hypothetical protein
MRRSRYVAWRAGILTDTSRTIHHLNANKLDDRPENLAAITKVEHDRRHTREFSPQRRQRISEALRGKPKSVRTRERISQTLQGNTNASGQRGGQQAANIRAAVERREARRAVAEADLRQAVRQLSATLSSRQVAAKLGIRKDRVLRLLRA